MELRQLRYFLTVAEEGHFTRAAEKLYISQPALSQQIRQLEEEVGMALFERLPRAIRLTTAGATLAVHARRILQAVEEAQTALAELAGLARGSLRIGVVQTVNAYWMPQLVARFTRQYPAIELHVDELPADDIEAGLLDGTLHVGIGFVPPTSRDIQTESLFTEELVLIVAQEHPLAAQAEVPVQEVAQFPLILLPRSFCTRRLWEASAAQAGVSPKVLIEMNTIGTILAAVRQTNGATVLPALALAGDGQPGLTAVRLVAPTPRRTVGLMWRRRGCRDVAARAFAEIVRQESLHLDGALAAGLVQ
ncbi:MAG: LysR family transcriptional regulator [Litorilinea sp.]|nr:MAG: LysR family transcriptional regulator [Litorilinea sp.]